MELEGKFYSYKKIEMGYDEKLKSCIESACEYCVDSTHKSSEDKINNPLMLLGKIQSGKTRAYTGLISLAFDNEFVNMNTMSNSLSKARDIKPV